MINVPKPVVNVPRPAVTVNVPKPVINVPRPAVTVNVQKPAVVVPKVDVLKPAIAVAVPKVEVPRPIVAAPKIDVAQPPVVNISKPTVPTVQVTAPIPPVASPGVQPNVQAAIPPKTVGPVNTPMTVVETPKSVIDIHPPKSVGPVLPLAMGNQPTGIANSAPNGGSKAIGGAIAESPAGTRVGGLNADPPKISNGGVKAGGEPTIEGQAWQRVGGPNAAPPTTKPAAPDTGSPKLQVLTPGSTPPKEITNSGPSTSTALGGVVSPAAGSTNKSASSPTVQAKSLNNTNSGLTANGGRVSGTSNVSNGPAPKPMTAATSSNGTTQGSVASASSPGAAPSGYTYPVPPSGGCTDSSCKPGTYTLPPNTNTYCKEGCTATYIGGGQFSNGSPLNAATSAGSTITTGYGTTTITNSVTGESHTYTTPGTTPGAISGSLTGAGTGTGQTINVSAGGVSATVNGNGGASAPFSGNSGGQSVSSNTVNGTTTVTVGGQAVVSCGYSSCNVGSPSGGASNSSQMGLPSPRVWGFYQPFEPRPVTVFRLGEQIPSMPNVPDAGEVGPGNWYSYGYNAPPPPEPEDAPQQANVPPNRTQQANNNAPQPIQTNNNPPAPEGPQQADNNNTDSARCLPDPCYKSPFANPDMTPQEMQAEVNKHRAEMNEQRLDDIDGPSKAVVPVYPEAILPGFLGEAGAAAKFLAGSGDPNNNQKTIAAEGAKNVVGLDAGADVAGEAAGKAAARVPIIGPVISAPVKNATRWATKQGGSAVFDAGAEHVYSTNPE